MPQKEETMFERVRAYLFSDVRDLKQVFRSGGKQNPKQIKAHLADDNLTLVMEYPLTDGTYVTKIHRYPDEEMAKAGYQRFLRDVADRLPGHHQRQHLRAMRLNNELINTSHLDWKLGEEPNYGVENSVKLEY